MAEVAPPLFDSEQRRASADSRLKKLGAYIAEAFRFRRREYIGKRLYARLTGILFGAVIVVVVANILAYSVWTYTFKKDSSTLTGAGIALTIVTIVLAIWIVIRQLSLVRSRFRAAGVSYGEWNARHILLWFYAGSAIPAAAIKALSLEDSEFYRRLSENLATMPKPGQPPQPSNQS